MAAHRFPADLDGILVAEPFLDEGFGDVVRLHDRLYTGPLADELRLDLPVIPHVGVGDPTPDAYEAIVDDLNAEEFEIRGRMETLDVIGFAEETVETIAQVQLSTRREKRGTVDS